MTEREYENTDMRQSRAPKDGPTQKGTLGIETDKYTKQELRQVSERLAGGLQVADKQVSCGPVFCGEPSTHMRDSHSVMLM